jgi:hypothetical protein
MKDHLRTVAIPLELEQALCQCAQQRRMSLEHLVHEALAWYLQMNTSMLDEFVAWQEVRDEALELVERPPT